MGQVKKLVTKNIYFIVIYAILSVFGMWAYSKFVRARKTQREIQNLIKDMRQKKQREMMSKFVNARDSISKL